jgi:hypothetical protein
MLKSDLVETDKHSIILLLQRKISDIEAVQIIIQTHCDSLDNVLLRNITVGWH